MTHVINNFLIGLNNLGRVFCDYAAGVFVQSALLVIFLLVVDLLLRKRVRAVFRYCVWLLVLVKLILPPMLSLPTGIGYWVGGNLPASSALDRTSRMAGLERASPSSEMPQVRPAQNITEIDALTAPADSALTPLTWQAVLFIIWLVGVSAFLVVLVQRVRFVRGLIAASRPAKEELLSLLEQCRRKIDVHWDIRLRISDTIPSPAVCGFFRPIVLIPTPLVEKLSPEGLRATLIHELAHIKRGDLWVNSVQTFLQVIYFYNPFVWFANAIIRRVCEEAVDETVLVVLGGQAKNYSNTLIDIGEMAFWRADLGLRLIGVAESKKALKWRIKHMLNRPIPKSAKIGVLGTIVIIVIAAVLLPMAKAGRETRNSVKLDENGRPTVKASDPAAVEIIQKVQAKYAGLDSYSSEGEIVSDMDMSSVDVDTITGMTDDRTKKLQESKELQDALKKRQTFKHTFSIKLARPDYYIEWDQKVHEKFSNIGAVWSDGKEHFIFNAKRKTSPKDRRMALASATGVSGGAANTIPSLFFAQPANILHQLNEVRQEGEEAIDGDQCYIIAGKMANMTMKYWISKDTLLIRQRQQILGDKLEIPELSDEDIKKSLELAGEQATDGAIRKFKDRIRLSRIMASKMKGTITEIHRNIVINQPIDFKTYISKYADTEITEPVIRTPEPQIDQNREDMQVLKGQKADTSEISGIVIDQQGTPIEGVLVDVWSWYSGNETYTDKKGFFQLNGFDPDQKTVEIRFSKDKYSPRYILKQPLGLKDTQVILDDKTYFEGKVIDSNSKPVPNALIRAIAGPKRAEGVVIGEVPTEITSRDDGSYRLYVQADVYDIQVKAAQGVVRLPKVDISKNEAKQLDLKLSDSVTFLAKVVDKQTEQPVEGFRLYHWKHPGVDGTSDSKGLIEITGMLPGKFNFEVEAKQCGRWWSEQSVSQWNHYRIDDKDTGWQRNFDMLDFNLTVDMEPVNIFTEKTVRITGKVLDPDGNAVAGATATLARTGSGNSITGDTRYSFATDENGSFEMIVPASKEAQYNLLAHDGKYNEWRKWANGVLQPIKTNPGDIINDIVIVLGKPASVKGKVLDSSGNPVPNHKVRSQAFDKLGNRYYDPTTRADENGNFEIKFIRPGKHYVQAYPFWLTAEQAPEKTSKIIKLEPGQTIYEVELVAVGQ
jgi:beta-lactamase regulating signal transducer with metallopeptidase domain/protocatechuate 3,4-dioxygenase beta subunit